MAQGIGTTIVDFGSGAQSAIVESTSIAVDTPPNLYTPGWISSTLPSSAAWRGVEYGNGVYFAYVPSTTTSATSTDGVTWTARTLPASVAWSAVAFGNGCFVLVNTANNTIYRSTDAISWTPYTVGASSYVNVKFVNGYFYACNGSTTTSFYRSADGITWDQITVPSSGLMSFEYANGIYVAVPAYSTTVALYSTDGITWNTTTIPAIPITEVAYGNGYFVVSQDNASAASTRSVDGIVWETVNRGYINNTYDVKFSPNISKFVFTMATGVILSNYGIDSQTVTVPTAGTGPTRLSKVADQVCVVSNGGTVFARTSDGLSVKSPTFVRTQSNNSTTIRAASPFAGQSSVEFSVTGIAGIQATDNVQVWVMGDTTLNNHNAMEHLVTPIKFRVTSITAGSGFTVQATSPYRLTGTYKVRYAWSS